MAKENVHDSVLQYSTPEALILTGRARERERITGRAPSITVCCNMVDVKERWFKS